MKPGTHGSTFGGNPLAMSVGNAVIDVLFKKGFLRNVRKNGKYFQLELKKLQDKYPSQNKTAMFVGGCVRKYLSNETIDDIDIATSLKIDQIKEKFKNTKFNIIDSGLKHGSVTLVSNKLRLELLISLFCGHLLSHVIVFQQIQMLREKS